MWRYFKGEIGTLEGKGGRERSGGGSQMESQIVLTPEKRRNKVQYACIKARDRQTRAMHALTIGFYWLIYRSSSPNLQIRFPLQ